jgi:type I restriction enzyme S subunit
MSVETFFDNFELLTDAPNTANKLREIILQLAVWGKLVSQDPSDESALLSRASKENEAFQQIEIFEEIDSALNYRKRNIPTLPHGWEWARLIEVVVTSKSAIKRGPFGSAIRKEFFVPDGYKVYEQKNAIYNDFELGTYFINEEKFNELKDFEIKPNDIIISCSGTIGRIAIAPQSISRGIINQALLKITLNEKVLYNSYFKILFPAFFMTTSVLTELKGTAIKNIIGVQALKQLLFPIPPLAEQKRIVDKCDHLLSLCNQIEVRQQKRQESIVRMNESAITQLLSSQNPEEFSQHWQRICDNFDLLYSIPETIPKLRQAILQLAVQGKLVRQDPNDELVSILLEKIEFEKKRLLKEGQHSKSKLHPSINWDEIPYEIPHSWHWLRLGDLVESMNNGLYKPARFYSEDGVACVRMFNIQDGRLDFTEIKRIIVDEDELENYKLEIGDLIVNRVNSRELVGKAALVQEIQEPLIYEAMNIRVRFIYKQTLPAYINLLLRTNMVRAIFQGGAKQASGQASVSQPQVANILVPLPPLAEQKRIIAKVNHLISLCNTLEAKLKEARSHSQTLMEVAAKQVLVA